ncbi:hypothetical protein OQA88_8228 [Cercophora sp. LCS_1]
MARRISLLLLLLTYITIVLASAQTFCKCTCFSNSTIISLGPKRDNPPPAGDNALRASTASCKQCTKAFCLDYNLPICKNAEEKDVVTNCFQRDSRKDQIIVWGFILGTAGLLGAAGLRKLMELREGKGVFGRLGGDGRGFVRRDGGGYTPVEATQGRH